MRYFKRIMKRRLDATVREKFAESWGTVRGWISTGKILVNGEVITDPGTQVEPDVVIELKMNAPRPRAGAILGGPGLSRSDIVYLDSQIVVVNKPAGMNTVPFEKGEQGSLEQLLSRQLGQARLVVVHRLDRETSGLLVFARTHEAGRALANQFRFHTVKRRYLALVHGNIKTQTIRSELVKDRGDGLRGSLKAGSGISRDEAKPAVTHVSALELFSGMTLVECRLETGRTHQIRIHLSEAGHPLLGERAYVREFRGERLPAPRIMLHAMELGIEHPMRKVPMRWVQAPPADFLGMLPGNRASTLE